MGAEHHFGARSGVASANNIQRLREQKGWSRPDLGKRMGTSGQQVERLEKGLRRLTSEWIDKAASALDVRSVDIIGALDDAPDTKAPKALQPTPSDASVPITSLDLSLSMGPGTLIEEFVEEEPVYVDLALLQRITRTPSDKLRFVRGIGDSMEPTLRTGDMVLIDINERQLSRMNGIYWIDHLGTHGIKRLRAAGKDRVMIGSDNPLVEAFEADAGDVRIEGRAIWFARDL